jgi:hypothetical protein
MNIFIRLIRGLLSPPPHGRKICSGNAVAAGEEDELSGSPSLIRPADVKEVKEKPHSSKIGLDRGGRG